jgi:prepilin signal peptidase PulO-like enzyme (type II secretory pathway)
MPWIITAVQMFLAADLVCLSFADWEVWLIPWQTTMLWIPLGLILAPLFPELHISATPWTGVARLDALFDSLQGIIIGGGLLWLIGFACIVFLRKEGMGEGDVHLVAMVGSFLGWKAALATIMLGCFAGSVLGLATIAYDRIQQARLGDQYTPRKPTFEAPEEEGAPNESPDWLYLAQGLFVLALSGLLLWFWRRWGGGWEEGPTPISATLSAILGLNLVLAYFLKKKMLAAGTWPKPEVRTRKDGKKEEVYQGNYVAFGPALALAAIAVVFYDPAIRLAAEAYCLGHWPPDWLRLDWKVPGLG